MFKKRKLILNFDKSYLLNNKINLYTNSLYNFTVMILMN